MGRLLKSCRGGTRVLRRYLGQLILFLRYPRRHEVGTLMIQAEYASGPGPLAASGSGLQRRPPSITVSVRLRSEEEGAEHAEASTGEPRHLQRAVR